MARVQTNLPIWPQEHQPVSDMGDKDRCDPAKLLEECKAGVAELEFHPRSKQSKEAFLWFLLIFLGQGTWDSPLGITSASLVALVLGFPAVPNAFSLPNSIPGMGGSVRAPGAPSHKIHRPFYEAFSISFTPCKAIAARIRTFEYQGYHSSHLHLETSHLCLDTLSDISEPTILLIPWLNNRPLLSLRKLSLWTQIVYV